MDNSKIMPLVSIVVPCYNGEGYIERCIESIINQSYKKIELIIINDGSTDSTRSILEEYKIKTVWCDEKEMKNKQSTCVRIERELLEKLSVKETHRIKVELM